MNGVLIVDKPAGWTSHDVVNRMRRILQQRSIGHLGTLDPLATGVLPLVTGSLTRLAQFYTASEKTYVGVIRLGFATTTYDADGEPQGEAVEVQVNLEDVERAAAPCRGIIEQTPPPFSAKKIHGVPAYKLARRQQPVSLKPVQVEVKEFTILSVQGDRCEFRARVSSGTYMRSIAHGMGVNLGCGGHLSSLRRTAVAEFDVSQAHTVEEIEAAVASAGAESLERFFIHPRELLPQLPAVTTDDAGAARIRSGRPVNLPELSRARQVKVFCGQRELLAIATRVAGTLFHPRIVFVSDSAVAARS